MTLSELANTLPNGFHDADFEELELDYVARNARLSLNLWVGDLSSNTVLDHERRRRGRLTLCGFQYFIIEPPVYVDHAEGAPWIDIGEMSELRFPPVVQIPALHSEDLFQNWIFVDDWNSFIYVAAQDAKWEWSDCRSTQ